MPEPMGPDPLLSVVIPASDVEQYLDDCLASVLRQELDQEIVVVDDASADASAGIAREQAARNPRIRVIESARRLGPGAARNLGLRAARGRYVSFVDSDDMVADGGPAALLQSLERTGSDLATSRADEFDGEGRRRYWTLRAPVFDTGAEATTLREHPELIWDHTVWTRMYRRSFLLEAGIEWPEGVLCEDVVPAARCAVAATSIDVVPRCTYLYRRRPGSITGRLTTGSTLTDWSDQTLRALRVLAEAQQDEAVQHAVDKLLRVEVRSRLRAARSTQDPLEVSAVHECVEEILSLAGSGVLDRLPLATLREVGELLSAGSAGRTTVVAALGEDSARTQPAQTLPRQTRSEGGAPLISVVVPTFDVAPWIEDCLDSILEQDHERLEIIVVDDHSSDGTWETVRSYADAHPQLTALRSPGAGGAQARNAGIARATGEYLAFVDGDDMLPLHAYSRLLAAARSSQAEVTVGGFQKIWATGAWRGTGYGLEERIESTSLLHHPQLLRNRTCWNKLVRRDFWEAHGLRFPTSDRANDIVPVTRLLAEASRLAIIPDVVYHYRARPGSSSMTASLGTARSTVAHLVQERLCAVHLDAAEPTRVHEEFWTMALGADAWIALDRFVGTAPAGTAPEGLEGPEPDGVARALAALLDLAPEPMLRALDPRRRLGLALAARADFPRFAVLRDLVQAHEAAGAAPVPAEDPHGVLTAAARVLDVVEHAARQDLHRPSVLRVLHDDVLRPLARAAAHGSAAAEGPARGELGARLRALGARIDLTEAVTPGTAESQLLRALLASASDPRDRLDVLDRLARAPEPLSARVSAVTGRRVRLEGTDPARSAAILHLVAREVGPRSGAAGETPTEHRLLGAPRGTEGGWVADVDLGPLAPGRDWSLLARTDEPGPLVPVVLSAGSPAGPLAAVRVITTGDQPVLRTLEQGSGRLRRAVGWRLRRLRRTGAHLVRGARRGTRGGRP